MREGVWRERFFQPHGICFGRIGSKRRMTTARVFHSGSRQFVILPKGFRFSGKQVEIFRRGGEIVLREKIKGLARAFDIIASLPSDVLPARRKDSPPQRRNGL
jgi:antitoxin VapB